MTDVPSSACPCCSGAILLGLLLGLWAGGRMSNLATIRLRWAGLLFLAVIVRFGTEALLNAGVDIVETLRLPLLLLVSCCSSSARG